MFLSRFRESVRCFLNEWNRKCCVGTGKTGESQYFLLKTISPHLNEKPHSSIPKKTRVYNNSDTGICCEVLRYTWHLLSHYICIQILNTCPWKLVVGFKKKKRKYFPGYQFITSRNLSTRLRIVIVRRKLVLVTVLRHEGLFDWRSFVWTQEKDVRIIIGNFDERSARKVFCQVRQWSKSSSWSDNSLWEFFQGLVVAVYLNFFFCRRYDQPRFCFKQLLEIHFIGSDNVWPAPRPHFPARPVFRVSWSERGFGRTFVSDTSTKCIDREDLGRRRQGIGTGDFTLITVGPWITGLLTVPE